MNHVKRNQMGQALVVASMVACTVLAAAVPSHAANISFSFSGTVGNVLGEVFSPGGTGSNGFGSSLPVSGTFVFNSATPDSNTGNSNIGRYNGAIQSLTVNVGNYTATYSPPPGTSFIRVVNNPSGDTYHLEVNGLTGPSVNGRAPSGFEFTLQDPSGNAFTNDSLPTTPPSLSSFASNQWRLIFNGVGHRVQGALTSLVPLPASVWLFATGLIALVGLGSRGLIARKDS